MKTSRIATSLLGAALLFSVNAFAKENSKGALRLDETVTVDGTTINPGNYKVEWTGNGPDVQVSLVKGSQTVATFPAHVTEQASVPKADAYGSSEQPNGTKALTSIFFGGKHYALQLGNAGANQQAAKTSK